ncbi:MAG TPA: glycosyltransferase family 39 protein, partial [Myxococcales bacterium]|nr:glycosyltransferase family 39 protein [Myxococcales bacterium]
MEFSPEQLRGRTAPWGAAAALALAALVAFGLWLRLHALSAEGFGDDEVHKWLAANRYLQGIFSGDDVEHPMLMKWLIAASIAIGSKLGWAPETMTRLPNALAGGLSIAVVAQLGKRLFGRSAGLFAGALAAVSVTLIGYQRVAKEDTLLGLFLMLLLLCLAEAKAAADD